ncbi:MAG TPA: GtrA family protein [Isosphaeraceae bacterium]|nr:GtrA family protein [Isosphaeraceae bacterium]
MRALEGAGHDIEVLVAVEAPGRSEGRAPAGWRRVAATEPGRVAAVIEGLRRAEGTILLVLDPHKGYAPEDLARVVEPLADGTADLVIGSRRSRGLRGSVGALGKLLLGTSDPWSGLIGLGRGVFEEADGSFRPVGQTFSFELLARVGGRWAEVPLRVEGGSAPAWRPDLDELRHLKRLADHRFGNYSRLLQFCMVGGSGMVVDLTCYGLLQMAFRPTWLARTTLPLVQVSMALAAARTLAIAVALVWNFSLNRRLTFSDAREGSVPKQFATYVLGNLLGILVSLGLSLGLPRRIPFFNAHKLAAAVVGIVAATGISFSMSRWIVFRRRVEAPEAPLATVEAAG